MAKTPKKRKIEYLDPMSDEFAAAMTDAFREGVYQAVHGDRQVGELRAVHGNGVRRAKRRARR